MVHDPSCLTGLCVLAPWDLASRGVEVQSRRVLLLLVFDLSKRSCNEKTGISASRTGKQAPAPHQPPISEMESVIRDTYRQLEQRAKCAYYMVIIVTAERSRCCDRVTWHSIPGRGKIIFSCPKRPTRCFFHGTDVTFIPFQLVLWLRMGGTLCAPCMIYGVQRINFTFSRFD